MIVLKTPGSLSGRVTPTCTLNRPRAEQELARTADHFQPHNTGEHTPCHQVSAADLGVDAEPGVPMANQEGLKKVVEIIAHRLLLKAEEKCRRYEGRTPGAFVPLLLSSGGVLHSEMWEAWAGWASKDSSFRQKITRRVSCLLIEFRAHAYIWTS